MNFSRIKPLSYFKANAPEVLDDIKETHNPLVITVRGEAVAVVQDLHSYEQTQRSLELLRALSLTGAKVKKGDVLPVKRAFKKLRKQIKR
ncbi:MAG: type II toxin-antitoxin system Phd/YefM family antitoxin [Rhizomicrobium sp.]